ncbi:tetratricopeptide repeat protein [Aeromonas sp. 1HA1]|jgi:tetratricopeptide (TPR) repeat protein|uniref:tetratricopeptide repeat protein n=1 Tax=Aeromonas sp. 1HA1 TaxID=2699193 RepID=UPI0023DD9D72|nr:tetratricopeptide repeat protein [Aeromonas sp. 1HA1]MDF2413429.1 tetratricopeptide repeat protein [Aeromonas sp. 1HA1]
MKHATLRPRLGHSAILLLALGSGLAQAADALHVIQQQWAVCQYQQTGKAKESCLEQLSSLADEASAKEAFRTDLLIWSAIVKSSWAGAKGGLGALGLVKEAKAKLEIALKQDPKMLEGSAYTSLGSLYYQVPGWPVGFGDNEKAEQLLKQALAINPTGIDPNFFYGDFLLDQGRKDEAKTYLDKALAAPDRPGREVADQGRRIEIRDRLARL